MRFIFTSKLAHDAPLSALNKSLIAIRLARAIERINVRVRGADAPVIKPSIFDAVDAEVCLRPVSKPMVSDGGWMLLLATLVMVCIDVL